MTPEEAKQFYLDYNGYSFHMSREEPSKYNELVRLNPDKDMLKKWDEEILENMFNRIDTDPAHAWLAHDHIIKVMSRRNCDTAFWARRLLEVMERMDSLNAKNKILIIENMAGRTETHKDGGIFFFCRYTALSAEMNEVLGRITDSVDILDGSCRETEPGWADSVNRFSRAKANCISAFRKWHNQ